MKKSASASKKAGRASTPGHKAEKIHVSQASANEIRTALGITPAEIRVAARAIAAAKKSTPSVDRPIVAQKPKAVCTSAAKRVHAR